ncbi:DNA-binding protein [Brevibacillus laterosporus]|uniref:DNA-binding protein n=1 Tax=Brevibacillus laterosporus TaxID=1465 RepID=A0AAP3GE62_BRELA|nr:DNA-binding protein [Brevibacillus laterosporus]MCR8982873.1 DNA-binding protein [Brevibacillus laterosporus]MCZ0810029.1 DNA-binding protein [Brevibacillus laterosporus]MCZ0828659.1 DNA-binding protein [Brevibacillus laterosporus]MCZ0852702.1 DNA-binding protein [Brevibacillus laterosporus]
MTIPKQQRVIRPMQEEIKQQLKLYNYTLVKLSELTKISATYLSGFMHGHARWVLRVDQLNAIGRVVEKPDGWLYELYAEEYFKGERTSKKQLKAYLAIVKKSSNVFFSIGEELFHKARQKESIFFYQLVIDNDPWKHKERFSMSHYRLFQMSETVNMELLWKAVILFEPFRKGLPEHCQLDALLRLGNSYRTLHSWEEVGKYGEELIKLAELVYKGELFKKKRYKNVESSLFFSDSQLIDYYGQGSLLKAISLEKQRLYEDARIFLTGCTNLTQFEMLDESGKVESEKFRKLILSNICRLDILMGNTSILSDYLEFLEDNSAEILPGFVTIVESANKYGFSIDTILDKFSREIHFFENCCDLADVDRHQQFRYQLAIYYLKNKRPNDGIKEILKCMTLSTILNSREELIRCIRLFEEYRYLVSFQQERIYKRILEEVMTNESLKGRSHPLSEERPIVKH